MIVEPDDTITAGGSGDRGEVGQMTAEGCKSYTSVGIAEERQGKGTYPQNPRGGCQVLGVLNFLDIEEIELPPLRSSHLSSCG